MLVLTIRKSVWFGVFLLYLIVGAKAQGGAPTSQITISVYNDAHAPVGSIASAETTASRIFGEAGLNVKWMNCVPLGDQAPASPCAEAAFPTHFHVRILTRARNLPRSVFGIAYLSANDNGCYADIFLQPIANLRAASEPEVGTVLGYVMAHEIAHLLLGPNSHSVDGIMRAHWQKQELRSATRGELLFTPGQSQVMRQRLSSVPRPTVGD
jgi:hypothetical protein